MTFPSRIVPVFLGLLTLIVIACGGAASEAPAATSKAEPLAASAPVETKGAEKSEETILRVGLAFLSSQPAPPRGGFQSVKMGLAETLFRLGRGFEVEPWLATVANQLDENVWEIMLRQDVVFHNGAAVDA